ncbi:MAG: anti-sigma factor family protein [Chitinispirillaceae bacterium]
MNCSDCKPLLMGLMDNELTPEELSRVNDHLIRCRSCRLEYDELSQGDVKLKTVSFREPEDRVLQRVWRSPFSAFTRWSGILLVVAGYLVLIGYGAYEFVIDGNEPVMPKIALAAIITGFSILLLAVLRQRLAVCKTDPYKEVER